jgi:PadR family transcriptional regulator, regulatory protein PadR
VPPTDDPQWPVAWTRAALEMSALAVVCAHGPTHGYEVAKRLQAAGLGEVKGGTLYPVLGRLEDQGLLASQWAPGEGGPGRKVVSATAAGRAELAARRERWREWTAAVADVLATDPEGHR